MDLLGNLFFVPVEFCSTIYCNENNVAMATEISLSLTVLLDGLHS